MFHWRLVPNWKTPGGFSLAELLVAGFVTSLVVMGVFRAFRGVGLGTNNFRNKAFAMTMARDHLGLVKNSSFSRFTAADSLTAVPGVSATYYDSVQFPVESRTLGIVNFNRYSLLEKTRWNGTDFVAVSSAMPEMGSRRLTETIVWTEGGRIKNLRLVTDLQTTDRANRTVVLSGVVRSTMGVPVPFATCLIENGDYQERVEDTTGLDGRYAMDVVPSTYTMTVKRGDCVPTVLTLMNVPAANTVQDVTLQFSTGTTVIRGALWVNKTLKVSLVVGGVWNGSNFWQEYVEVYNPTTFTWTMANVGFRFQRAAAQDLLPLDISINYITPTLPPNKFYLFANVNSVNVGGNPRTADAVWNTTAGNPNFTNFFPRFSAPEYNIIPTYEDGGGEGAGGLELYDKISGTVWDRVGWQGSQNPAIFAVTPIACDEGGEGLNRNEEFRRISSTSGVSGIWGPAYRKGNNDVDFKSFTVGSAPRNASDPAQIPIAGDVGFPGFVYTVPIAGQVHFGSSTSYVNSGSGLGYAEYQLGKLPIINALNIYGISNGGVSRNMSNAFVPNGSVLTAHVSTGSMTTSSVGITGIVKDDLSMPLPFFPVANSISDAQGRFAGRASLEAGTGCVVVPAGKSYYGYYAQKNVTTNICGQIPDSYVGNISLTFNPGTVLKGTLYWKNTSTPYPGKQIRITNLGSAAVVSEGPIALTSNSLGDWKRQVPSTGTYRVEPILANGEIATPSDQTVSVGFIDAAHDIALSPFVVRSAGGTRSGTLMTAAGVPIVGGMVVAMTAEISLGVGDLPPNLPCAGGGCPQNILIGTSGIDGTYRLWLPAGPAGTTYNFYAWPTDGLPSSRRAALAQPVLADSNSVINFTW